MAEKRKIAVRAGLALVLIIAAGLAAVRIWLPQWATDYVNRQIAGLDGYGGSVREIDIHLWRGAYQIHDLNIFKTKGGLKKPFVAAESVDISVEWPALFRGRIVAEADIRGIDLNFALSQTGEGGGWGHFIDSLSPFEINRVDIHSGKIAYLDYSASPDVNIYITGIQGNITNLQNVEKRAEALPSDLKIAGTSIGNGAFSLQGRVNILQNMPDFDVNMKLENAALAALNNYTRKAAAVDFDKGVASIYSELAAAKGHVTGYMKFIATDVSVIDIEEDAGNPLKAVWETLVAGFMTIFKNHPRDQFALQVPIDGRIDNPQKDTWAAFLSIFRNAFGRAFPRDTDGNINFDDALRAAAR